MTKPSAPTEGTDVAALRAAAIAHHKAGDLAAADAAYRQVLALAPEDAETHYLSGALDHQLGATYAAVAKLERSLALRPDYVPALEMLGAAAMKAGRHAQAAQSFEAAAARKPNAPETLYNAGTAHFQAGAFDKAAAALQRALRLKPDYADALYLCAVAQRLDGQWDDAAASYAALVALQPNNARALDEYGGVLISLDRTAEAEAVLRRAIAAAPDAANAYTNLGRIFQNEMARALEALALHDQALARNPASADAHNNRGAALHTLSRFDEAEACFRKAIALKPNLAEAHNNLGNALLRKGDSAGAISAFTQAIALKDDYAEAHWNKAFALLMRGEWAAAWPEYEWRWRCKEFDFPPRGFAQSTWRGESLTGPLLVWGEQGPGEEVLCASMATDLAARGMNLVWECDARLIPLLSRSFPGIKAVARATPPSAATQSAQAQISTASLGQYLRQKPADFPKDRRGYLAADAERARSYRERALGKDGKRLIGVSWVSKNPEFGVHKTSTLAALAPLWQAAGSETRFVDLQYGDTSTERKVSGLALHHFDELDLFNDLDGVAALIKACDLVITVSNTTAHLAGALGVPVWVMTPRGNGKLWYWGEEGADSPWYSSARIFRQPSQDDWQGVIARVAQQLGGSATDVAALLTEAVNHHRGGRLQEAQRFYEKVLEAAPENFDAVHLLGVVQLQSGRAAEAVRQIGQAVALNAQDSAALNNYGHALRAAGRLDEALASYDRAIAVTPGGGEGWKNRGDLLQLQGKHDAAIIAYEKAVVLSAGNADAHLNHGASLQALGQYAAALASFDKAIALKPDHAAAFSNRGDSLRKLGRPGDAIASYDRALALNPALVDTHAKRGNALRDEGKLAEAVASFDRALALRADHVDVMVNRAAVLHETGAGEALAGFLRALAIEPKNAEAHWNSALVLLARGDWKDGWAEYEWRWRCKDFPAVARPFMQPQWDGGALSGPLLVWGEQGVGDEILYGSMIGDLAARGISVIWEADARLAPLLRRSFPNVRIAPRTAPTDPSATDPAIAAQIAAGSLGQHLRTNEAAFASAPRSYLRADAARTAAYRARLLKDGKTRLIGVSWVSKNTTIGADKTSRLQDWTPIWQAAGANAVFVDLQYGDTAAERVVAGLPLVHLADLDLFDDIDGLAALIKACDEVITVSNTTAHLAGALGVPVRVMIPTGAGKLWYWGTGGGARWYPSATLYRQSSAKVWGDTIQKIAGDLRAQ